MAALELESLCNSLEKEAKKMAKVYNVVEMKNQLIAHIRKKDKEIQPLTVHLKAVSKLAGEFAGTIGLKETGEVIGLLHDFGKANEKF